MPVLQENEPIAGLNRGQPMRDDDQRARAVQRRDGLGDFALGLVVERGGGFVEHEHGGIGIEGASDRHALALPTREPRAIFAEGVSMPCGS